MWDIQRLMWFDETFLKDPNGDNTELTIESFLGPLFMTTMIKPIIGLLFSPFYYFWCEVSFWTQLFIFLLFGLTPAQKIVDEETQKVESYKVTASIPEEIISGMGFGDDYKYNDYENYMNN